MADRLSHQFWAAALICIVSPISSSFQKLYAAFIALLSRTSYFFQQQNPPSFFTHKHFGFSMSAIFAFLQVVSPGMASPIKSNPGVYYVAVTTFLAYIIASAIEGFSSSSPTYRLPRCATSSLRWCKFFASSLSFSATASFLYRDSVRLAIFIALTFFIISVCALLYWVYETPTGSCCRGWRRCQLFFTNIRIRLARGRCPRQPRPILPQSDISRLWGGVA